MKKIFTREILIGLILFFSLAVLFVGIDYLKGMNVFKPSNIYYASFTDVTGLTVASPVTLNGMKIGQVTGIEYQYDNPGHVRVELDLDKAIKITRGSELLLSTSLLGTAELSIKMAPGNSYYDNSELLPGGKETDLMADLTNQVIPEVVKMLPQINSIIAHIDTLVANPALERSLSRLDEISRNLEMLSARLASASNQVTPVLANTKDVTANLKDISDDLKVLSAELKTLPVSETMDNLKTTTGNIAQITGQLNGTDSSLGLLLNDKGLYNHLDSTLLSLDSILIDLRHNPKKYVNFKLF